MPTLRLPLAMLLAGAVSAPHAAVGQSNAAAAELLFLEAMKAFDAGDFDAACPKLRESQRLDPAQGTLFNLAECEARRGRLATAWADYSALGATSSSRAADAKKRADELFPRVPRLTVKLAAGAPAATVITRDGVELGPASLNVPAPVDPGEHVVTASVAGQRVKRFTVTLAESEARMLEVAPEPAPAPAASPPPGPIARPESKPERPPAPSSSRRTVGLVVGGIGVAALGVGAVFGALALGKAGDVDEACGAEAPACPDLTQAELDRVRGSGPLFSHLGTFGLVAGAIGVGVGGFLILTSPSARAPSSARPRVRVLRVGLAASSFGASMTLTGATF